MSDEKAAIAAILKISETFDLNVAISIGLFNPINKGPINVQPPSSLSNFVEIAALCMAGIIKIFAGADNFENG